jgi:hypothetical protein
VNEVAGQDLGWYWQQAVYGTQVLDYKVRGRNPLAPTGPAKMRPKKKGETLYSTDVLLQRLGDFTFPVTAQFKFDNGETIRETWDGRDRWKRFVYVKKAKVLSVGVDLTTRSPWIATT